MPETGELHSTARTGFLANPAAGGAPFLRLLLAGAGLIAALAPATPAVAGPVVCTTTLEAPVANAAPVEMTRCGRVQSVPELATRRFYSYTAPFERGVSLTNQITDFFGIAMGGGDGSRVMGLGYPDQTIVWDGLALQNTTAVLMEAQSSAMPLRTADLSPCFTSSLADTSCNGSRLAPKLTSTTYGAPGGDPYGRSSFSRSSAGEVDGTVRGLW
ncbi:MAG: occludin/ELL family protein [Synechococcaceae cyanobacterium ELA263]|jgi:hypothetical protein